MKETSITKISSNLTVVVFSLLLVFMLFLFMVGSLQDADPIIIIAFCVIPSVGTFILSMLGGHILRGHKGVFRISIIVSIFWIIFCLYILEPYKRYGEDWAIFLGLSLIPILGFYSILWVIHGFISNKQDT